MWNPFSKQPTVKVSFSPAVTQSAREVFPFLWEAPVSSGSSSLRPSKQLSIVIQDRLKQAELDSVIASMRVAVSFRKKTLEVSWTQPQPVASFTVVEKLMRDILSEIGPCEMTVRHRRGGRTATGGTYYLFEATIG